MFEIKQPDDFIDFSVIKVLIYGQPGVRKTSWAFTARKVFLLNFEPKAMRRVAPQYRKQYADILSWNDVEDMFKPENLSKLDGFDTIACDTVGRLLTKLSDDIIKKNAKMKRFDGALSLQGYSLLAIRFDEFVRKVEDMGKDIVFVAHEKEKNKDESTSIRPDIIGQSQANILKDMDLVGYIRSHAGVATVTFDPSDDFYAKNSCNLPRLININEMSMAEVIDLSRANINQQTEEHKSYNAQLTQIAVMMNNVTTIDELNDCIELVTTFEFIKDAKKQFGNLVREKVKALDCKLNSDKKYVPKTEVPA